MQKIKFNKFITLLIAFICLSAILLLIFNYNDKVVYAYENKLQTEQYTLEDDFSEDSVLVVLDEKTSQVNKIHDVSFFKGADIKNIEDLTWYDDPDCEVVEHFQQILKINLNNGTKQKVLDTIALLQDIKGIESVEPNMISNLESVPNDEHFESGKQWALNGENGINAPYAWGITRGERRVRVGILDSGVAEHPDLKTNIVDGKNYYSGGNVTNIDKVGHGTFVAGIIGAVGNNGQGICGVNWDVSLVPFKLTDSEIYVTSANTVKAIQEISMIRDPEKRIDIINYSVAGLGIHKTIRAAVGNYSGLFVWAAGNENEDIDIAVRKNGSFDLPNIICVGAITSEGERWYHQNDEGYINASNFSSSGENVNIYAPGADIISTYYDYQNNTYSYLTASGTSYAAPHVTGVAAMLLSINKNLTAAELKQIILNSADETTISVYDYNGQKTQKVKKLNAYSALTSIMFETGDFDGGLMIKSLKYEVSNVKGLPIPEEIGGKQVKGIYNYAFQGNNDIKYVVLPSTLKFVGESAFRNCNLLESIDFDYNGVEPIIGSYAFAECENLEFLTLPKSLVNIPPYMCYNSRKLYIVATGEVIYKVGNYAFCNCESLVRYDALWGVEYIGDSAFCNCFSLETSIYSDALYYLGAYAFKNCERLETIEFASQLEEIKSETFRGCTNLTDINLSSCKNLQTIGSSAFCLCKSVKQIFLPNSLKTIGGLAFSACSALENIYIPNSIESMGVGLFGGCMALTIFCEENMNEEIIENYLRWNNGDIPMLLDCQFFDNTIKSFVKTSKNPRRFTTANEKELVFYRPRYTLEGWCTLPDCSDTPMDLETAPNGRLYAKWTAIPSSGGSCIAEGSLITLADGRQVAVEELTGDELLLVWNLQTGRFDVAPIMFIDSEIRAEYEIIKLRFADGTVVKVIDEHGFWDVDLNRYVYLRNDAAKYIGHRFNKQTVDDEGNMIWTSVELVGVDVYKEVTTAWSPVTSGHLCYYVNGMLSMPGGIEGLFNIFEVDGEAMKYDEEAFAEDINTYGLFSYEEFAALVPVSQEVFEAFGGQYLKIAIGKGLITVDKLNALAERYAKYF